MSNRQVSNTNGEQDGPPSAVGRYVDIETPALDIISNTNVTTAFVTTISLTNASPAIAVGDVLRFTANGILTVASPGALLFEVLNQSSVILTTASTLTSVSGTRGWWINGLLAVLAADSECQGTTLVSTSASAAQIRDMASGGRTGVDLTVGTLKVRITWAVADPGNSIQLRQMVLERMTS